jgi:hypothetical protein
MKEKNKRMDTLDSNNSSILEMRSLENEIMFRWVRRRFVILLDRQSTVIRGWSRRKES